jgi:amidase
MRIPGHAAALLAAALLLGAGAGSTIASPAVEASANVSLHGVDLERSTIPELQRAMDRHRISSIELTIFYLARIRQLNPDLHAVIATSPTALAEALLSDLRRVLRQRRGPMDGIPVLLKDNVDTRVMPTTAGSEALANARHDRDAFLVRRLRAGGAVILGKTNLSEWANFRSFLSSSGWSGVGGQTANP